MHTYAGLVQCRSCLTSLMMHGRQPTTGVLSVIRTWARWACLPCATILSMPVLPTFHLYKTLQSVTIEKYVQNHGCADTNWATETFKQVNATSCQNDQGRSPRYDHCGLYIYGEFPGPQTTSHLQGDGRLFDSTLFWSHPTSTMSDTPLPYLKPSKLSSSTFSFISRLQHIMQG